MIIDPIYKTALKHLNKQNGFTNGILYESIQYLLENEFVESVTRMGSPYQLCLTPKGGAAITDK